MITCKHKTGGFGCPFYVLAIIVLRINTEKHSRGCLQSLVLIKLNTLIDTEKYFVKIIDTKIIKK